MTLTLSTTAAMSGVITTYSPVIKPVIAAPVRSSPSVCRVKPAPRKNPANAERKTRSLLNNLNTRGRSRIMISTANAKRLKRKLFTLWREIESFIITNERPQDAATRSSAHGANLSCAACFVLIRVTSSAVLLQVHAFLLVLEFQE